jgi:hypothetical protein
LLTICSDRWSRLCRSCCSRAKGWSPRSSGSTSAGAQQRRGSVTRLAYATLTPLARAAQARRGSLQAPHLGALRPAVALP